MSTPGRKPRIALMGEFSAGKSTLSNLLLGARPLPEKVTATRLSPVWMSEGTQAPYRVDVDGTEEPVALDQLEGISVEETRVIRLFFQADILTVCDLIDFPGISDPNMSPDVWQRMLDEVDAILWCTHATQAWRQSEAAVWDTIPQAVRDRSILLVTRFDKLTSERDQFRVMARLGKETEGLFGGTFPISLTEALAAGENYDAFQASGAGDFLEHFITMIDALSETVEHMPQTLYATASGEPANEATPQDAETSAAPIKSSAPNEVEADIGQEDTSIVEPENTRPRVTPRRVRPSGSGARSERPLRPKAEGRIVDMLRNDERPSSKPASNDDLRAVFKSARVNTDDEVA